MTPKVKSALIKLLTFTIAWKLLMLVNSGAEALFTGKQNGGGGYKDSESSIFLGCFVTWESLSKVIGQGAVLGNRFGGNGCKPLYSNETNSKNHIILTRGDLCILTNWERVLEELKDFTQIQTELCDLDCPLTFNSHITSEHQSPQGLCGGNYFFSVSCLKSFNTNFLHLNPELSCIVPGEISTNLDYVLPENPATLNDLEYKCHQMKDNDVEEVPKTYLPKNSPVDCAGFCQGINFFQNQKFDVQNLTIGVVEPKEFPQFHYNCFCLSSDSEKDCLRSPCANCHESDRYLSVYKSKMVAVDDQDSRKLIPATTSSSSVVLDVEPYSDGWLTSNCEYFHTYEQLLNSCFSEEDDEHNHPYLYNSHGFWSTCQQTFCSLNYASPIANEYSLKSITIRYYMRAWSWKGCRGPLIIIKYRNNCTDRWKRTLITTSTVGWGWSSHTANLKGQWKPAGYPQVEIRLISNLEPCDKIDVVVIDKVSLTMESIEKEPAQKPDCKDCPIILDVRSDMKNDWTMRGCTYGESIWNFRGCEVQLPRKNGTRSGFWSNCPDNYTETWDICTLKYTVSDDKILSTLGLSAYVRKSPSCPHTNLNISFGSPYNLTKLDVNYKNGVWTDINSTTLPLPDLVAGNVIIVTINSGHYNSLVLLDKIVLELLAPPSGTPNFTTTPKPSETTSTTTTTTTTTAPMTCRYKDMCNQTDYRGVRWSACPGEIQNKTCPGGASGFATWECSEQFGIFDPLGPNYGSCSSEWYKDIEESVDEATELPVPVAHEYLTEIEKQTGYTVSDQAGFFGHEIKNILTLAKQILMKVDPVAEISVLETLTNKAVAVFRNILICHPPWSDLTELTELQTGALLIHCMEASTLELTERVIVKGAGESYEKLFDSYGEISASATSTEKFVGKLYYPEDVTSADVSVEIPEDWASYFPDDEIVDFTGMTIQSNYANSIFMGNSFMVDNSHSVLNGHLVSFTFGNGTDDSKIRKGFTFTGNGIRIKFKHDAPGSGTEVKEIRRKLHEPAEKPKVALDGSTSNPCVYLDITQMNWSTVGCSFVEQNESYTICECNHLSSFAVLMSTHSYIGKDKALEYLSLTLTSVSVICLALSIGIYSMPSIAAIRGQRSIITLHMCICLLIGNILMVAFVDRNYIYLTEGFCTTFGIMAHYFFLAAFFWMAFEGYVLYKVLVVVFDDGKDRFAMQYLVSYGCPGIIVAVTVITAISLRHNAYESDMYCWLAGDYIWAFMGPVALILIGNTVMLALSIQKARSLSKNSTVKSHSNRRTKSFMTWIKGCAGLMCLLGITWGVGYFMLIENNVISNIAAYIFTVLNASQGVFLFIFHICMNKKIRQVLSARLPRFFSSQKTSASTADNTGSSPSVKLTDTCLTFGTTWSRRKAKFWKYFERESKDMKDVMMPKSDAPTTRRAKAKLNKQKGGS